MLLSALPSWKRKLRSVVCFLIVAAFLLAHSGELNSQSLESPVSSLNDKSKTKAEQAPPTGEKPVVLSSEQDSKQGAMISTTATTVPALSPEVGLTGQGGTRSGVIMSPDFSSGAVGYKIPIALPLGIAGMQPELYLEHNSRSSNDMAGVGWRLNIKSIDRSLNPRLDYNGHDFTLTVGHSNSAIIRTSQSGDLETYQPRFEGSFDAITRNIGAANSWQVINKNGILEVFGDSDASRIVINGQVYSWLLSYVQDSFGNRITYIYKDRGGEKYLDMIVYGARPGSPLPQTCIDAHNDLGCAQFEWSNRSDVEITYERNGPRIRTVRLSSIKIYSEGAIFDTYMLAYDFEGQAGAYSPATGRSLLTSVSHAGTGSIETGEKIASFKYDSAPITWRRELWPSAPDQPPPYLRIHGDFNGDGRTDIAFSFEDGGYNWYMYISEGTKWRRPGTERWSPGPRGRWWSTIFTDPSSPGTLFMPIPWAGVAADFSGDGRSDIVYAAGQNQCLPHPPPVPSNQVDLCNPFNWVMFTASPTTGWLLSGFDYWPHGPRMSVHDVLQQSTPWEFYSFMALCSPGRYFDDPRSGFACFDENSRHWQVAIANDGDVQYKDWVTTNWHGPLPKSNEVPRRWIENCHFGDFDGDQFTDVACQDRDNTHLWHVGLLRNNSWTVFDWSVDTSISLNHSCIDADINVDGRSDMICQKPSTNDHWTVLLSTGSGWANNSEFRGPRLRDIRFCGTSDATGDGRPDLFCLADQEGVFEVSKSLGVTLDSPTEWQVGTEPGSQLLPKRCSFGDFTGDGTIDAACSPNDKGKYYISRAVNPFPDSLVEVTDYLGAKTTLNYGSSTEFNNIQLPFPIKVLKSWSVKTSSTRAPLQFVVSYDDGFFDIKNREFLGFGHSKVVVGSKSTESWFGHPAQSVTARDRIRLTKTVLTSPSSRVETNYDYFASSSADAPYFDPIKYVRQTQSDCLSLGNCGQPELKVSRFFEYDNKGNLTASLDFRSNEQQSLLTKSEFQGPSPIGTSLSTKSSEVGYSINSADLTEAALLSATTTNPGTHLSQLASSPNAGLLNETRFSYDSTNECGSVPVGSNAVTEVKKLIAPNNWATFHFGYDDRGNLICKSDPNSHISRMSFDANGRDLVSIASPNGMVSSFEHYSGGTPGSTNGLPGQLRSSTVGPKNKTTFQYDRFGRMTKSFSESSLFTEFHYTDSPAQMTFKIKVTKSDGSILETTHDGAGFPIVERRLAPENKWTFVTSEWDDYGNKIRESLPTFEGQTPKYLSYKFDDLHRLILTTYSNGDSTSICYAGNITRSLNPRGNLRSLEFNNRGSLISLSESDRSETSCSQPVTQNIKLKARITRDVIERPIAVEDGAGVRWSMVYDNSDRLLESKDSNLSATHFSYDAAGNLKAIINPDGSTVGFEYNSVDEPIKQTQSVGGKRTVNLIDYDPLGRIHKISSDGSTTSFQYDDFGRLTGMRRKTNKFLWLKWDVETLLGYNGMGQLSTVRYPDKSSVDYKYDVGRIVGINRGAAPIVNFSNFDEYGRWRTKQMANCTSEWREFNDRGWMASWRLMFNRTELLSKSYSYDQVGNPIKILSGSQEYSAEYDIHDRLISFGPTRGPKTTFSFNRSNSILSAGENGTYTYPGPNSSLHEHSPVTVGSDSLQHDLAGRIVSMPNYQLQFDTNGQLKVLKNGKSKTQFKYDGMGEFSKISRGLFRSNYYFSDFFNCVEGDCVANIVGPDSVEAESGKQGELEFIHRDVLGSVVAITDPQGKIVWQASYDPFGRIQEQTAERAGPLQTFAGGRRLPKDDRLVKLGARFYDTALGMFLQPDPLSLSLAAPDNINRYSYADNNPLRNIDPTGLDWGWGSVSYNWNSTSFGGSMSFDMNIFNVPAFDRTLFNQDLQKFYEQLNRMNAKRFAEFAATPSEFLPRGGRIPGSLFGLPAISGADYQKGSLRAPPFAAVPTVELLENIKQALALNLMAKMGYEEAALATFAWKSAPRIKPLNWLGEGSWDLKANVGNVRNLQKLIVENAGNFNYGATGAAMGFSLDDLLKAAGLVNYITGNSDYRAGYTRGEYGKLFRVAPYGDDDLDQYWIIRGYQYFKTNRNEIMWYIRQP